MNLRRAQTADAETLTELALRSKAHWGYDAAFIEACRPELTITANYIGMNPVKVATASGQIVGFYSLAPRPDELELDQLFIEPAFIGRGIGKLLWNDAVETARELGHRSMFIVGDPYAETFYLKMGAERIGAVESTVSAGRMLPLLRYHL